MTKYSVLLLRPDYATNNFGQDNFYTFVEADTPSDALLAARLEAFKPDNPEPGGTGAELDDYAALLVIEGHHPALA